MSWTVRPGETLWGLAQRFLGNGNRWHELTGYAGDPHRMPIGTVIYLPGESGPAGHPPATASAAQAAADQAANDHAAWMAVLPEQRAAILDMAHTFETQTDFRIPINDAQFAEMAKNGINTAYGFAKFVWDRMDQVTQANMPWAQYGMSHDVYAQAVQQYGDVAAKYLGGEAGLDPAFLQSSLEKTQGRLDINSFTQQLMTDQNILKTHGWVQYGMTFQDFQNFKGDSSRAFGSLTNDQAVNVLKDQHAQAAQGGKAGSTEFTGGTQSAMSPKSKGTPASSGVEQSSVR
jgi:hypothetical protein